MVELPVHRNPSIGGMATDNKVASETSLQLLMLATKCENAMTGPFKFSVSLIILHLFSGVVDLIRTLVLFRTIHAQKFSPCNGNLTRSSQNRHKSSVTLRDGKTPRRRTVHVPKNVSKQFSDQPSASARQPAGGGAEPS